MSIINNTSQAVQQSVTAAKLMLTLLFPEYQLQVLPNLLLLTKILQDGSKEQCIINNDNFQQFKSIIREMFCLSDTMQDYNPASKKAEQIANKLRNKRKMMSKKSQASKGEINVLYHQILILTLGNHHTIPQLMEYTVYQLFNEFNKFEKKYSYDIWLQSKMAGATGLEQVDNWLSFEEGNSSQNLPKSNRIEF